MSYEPLKDKGHQTDSRVLVQVQCEGFRCMAYRDETGAWIDFHTGQLLKGNVQEVRISYTD